MRIHNTVQAAKPRRRWPVPAAVGVLILVTGANLFTTGDHSAGAVGTAPKQLKRVQVARFMIPAGKIIDQADLAIEDIPETAVPEGAVTDAKELIGHAAASPIPANSPISSVWIAEDEKDAQNAAAPLGTLGALLTAPTPAEQPPAEAQPAESAASLFLKVRGQLPPIGSRVAIGIEGKKGRSAVVLAETKVASVSGRQIELRMSKEDRDYLKAAQLLGKARLISIGEEEDENPFAGIVVSSLDELKKRLGIEQKPGENSGKKGQEQNG